MGVEKGETGDRDGGNLGELGGWVDVKCEFLCDIPVSQKWIVGKGFTVYGSWRSRDQQIAKQEKHDNLGNGY